MDLNNLLEAGMAVAPWLFGALVYLAVVFFLTRIAERIFGQLVALWLARIMLLPIWVTAEVLGFVWDLKEQIKDQQLLWKEFSIENLDQDMLRTNQALVDDRLGELAEAYNADCLTEESLRGKRPFDRTALVEAARNVRRSKKAFWKAHELAQKNGFSVRRSFRNYLKTGQQAAW